MILRYILLTFVITFSSNVFSFSLLDCKIKAKKVVASTVVIVASATTSLFPQNSNAFAAQPQQSSLVTVDSRGRAASIQLPSGVQYFDYIVGTGDDIVTEGSSVQYEWVLRRSNGYFVEKSTEPFIYRVGNTKKVIKGLDEAIRGMRKDGVRRINVPAQLAFVEGVEAGKPGPIPEGFGPKRQILSRIDTETWYFEIKLLKLKN